MLLCGQRRSTKADWHSVDRMLSIISTNICSESKDKDDLTVITSVCSGA